MAPQVPCITEGCCALGEGRKAAGGVAHQERLAEETGQSPGVLCVIGLSLPLPPNQQVSTQK